MSTRLFTTLLLISISFIGFLSSMDSLWFVIAFFASMRYTFSPMIKPKSKEDSIRERLKVIDDINGNPIYEGDIFTFVSNHEPSIPYLKLNGFFKWDEFNLRYEIYIGDNYQHSNRIGSYIKDRPLYIAYNPLAMEKFELYKKKNNHD